MSKKVKIGDSSISHGSPVYIVAEMSANHNQHLDEALSILDAAKDAGADAVKIQTYTPDTITLDVRNEYFEIGNETIWKGKNLYDLYSEAFTPWDWHEQLANRAKDLGLGFFSTPFDESAVDFLEEMDVPAYKVASFEIVDLPLLRKIAQTKKPVIMSTGMATLSEIDEAVRTLRESGNKDLVLLKCTSAYPAPPEESNLRTIEHLAKTFDVLAGLSDHTMSVAVPVAAVALGAAVIEKHFTLSRDMSGPDSLFSLNPSEFRAMVDAVRVAEVAVGNVSYDLTDGQKSSRKFRPSLFVVEDMAKGDVFTEQNVRSIRPFYGLHTRYIDRVIGRKATCNISKGTPVSWDDIG